MNIITLYLYPKLNFIILKKNTNINIYIYNIYYFFSFSIYNFNLNLKKSLNIVELQNKIPYYNQTKLNHILNNFLFSWNSFFYKKISFSGRGFKKKKKKNCIFLFFNKSHVSLYICNNAILKKLNRNKLLIFYKNWNIYQNNITNILRIRYVNIYTKRGLRLSRQIILKKKGKGGTQTQA